MSRWILVSGAGVDLHESERTAASRLGSLLAREGYGLIAGTWGGVDEQVTRAFVSSVPEDEARSRIIHVENHDWRSSHNIRVGRVIKSSSSEAYSPAAVDHAHAGIIVSGRQGAKATMDALIGLDKPVIPLAWLGHDAFDSLQDLLRDTEGVARNYKRLLASLIDPACGSDETISRVLASVIGTPHAIFISYHRDDAGADAGRLAAHLAGLYGTRRVFIDYESLAAGESLDLIVSKAHECRLLIVMIGPEFSARTARESDYVRREILAAMSGGAMVLAVLVDREFSSIAPLPDALQFLALRNVVRLSRTRWEESLRSVEAAADRALGVTRMREVRD